MAGDESAGRRHRGGVRSEHPRHHGAEAPRAGPRTAQHAVEEHQGPHLTRHPESAERRAGLARPLSGGRRRITHRQRRTGTRPHGHAHRPDERPGGPTPANRGHHDGAVQPGRPVGVEHGRHEGGDPPDRRSKQIERDPDRLQQLFENLISNAITHGGPATTCAVGTADGSLYFEDDGTGIPEEDRELVFESGFTTEAGNMGLGLTIVERIASAHGWELEITDSADGGARLVLHGVSFQPTMVN
ncbi:hypothetical protein DMP03_04595 [Halosegnis rubeus]|uniref:histidine kinase n=1 Tax=Halosegnis rubeus TaxID=2212850 RepID=A0A5N5UD59_9EURY|nr:hypothetical protein DMP03_04595 [Halosegnis rubeus]